MTAYGKTAPLSENNFFELLDYVHDLPVAYVAAQIAQSTAWRIDAMLVAESRNLFKHVRSELFEQGGIESLAELTSALANAEFAEHSFNALGMSDEGTLETIRALNAQRDQWHDLAKDLTALTSDWSGAQKNYVIPDLEEVFLKEPTLKLTKDTQRRLKMSATRTAQAFGGDDAMAERMFARKVDKQKSRLEDMAENLKEQGPTVYHMFKLTLKSDATSAALRGKAFHQLPLRTQHVLLENAAAAAARADEWASTDRSLSDSEYDFILGQSLKVQTDVKNILSGSRFRRVAETV